MRRALANLLCGVLAAFLPVRLQPWGRAVRAEVASIANDTEALLFALASLCGLLPRAIATHLFHPFTVLAGRAGVSSGGSTAMRLADLAVQRPRATGIVCAVAAVILGLGQLTMAGAPVRYLAVNAGALALGLVVLVAGWNAQARWRGVTLLAMAAALLGTAVAGEGVEGATRWFRLGPLLIQPSLALLPAMIVGFARGRDAVSVVALMIAAVAMAVQPDRAMAGMLVAGCAVLVVMRPDRMTGAACAAAIAGFAVTLVRADGLPAVPHVDQVLYAAFSVHVLAGLAVAAGLVLLLVPAVAGWRGDPQRVDAFLVFGAVWLAAISAALLGNYPTPVVGYSGSAVLGYVLSLAMLPKDMRRAAPSDAAGHGAADPSGSGEAFLRLRAA